MTPKRNTKKLTRAQRTELLSVAAKLKGKELFPEKNEQARNYLKKAKFVNL